MFVNSKSKALKRLAIEVRPSTIDGYGVFANQFISRHSIIEECPLIAMLYEDVGATLENYVFSWETNEQRAVVLGYGSIYNHAVENNVRYYFDYARKLVVIVAIKNIYRGDEICTNYSEAWFKARNISVKAPKPRQYLFNIPYLDKILLIAIIIFSFYYLVKSF